MSDISDAVIADFSSITGVADLELARQYLTLSDGDLQQAITIYFESGQQAATSQLSHTERETVSEEFAFPEETIDITDTYEPEGPPPETNHLGRTRQEIGRQENGFYSPPQTDSREELNPTQQQPYIPPVSELFADDPAVLDLDARGHERTGGSSSSLRRVDRNQPYIYQEAAPQVMMPWRDTPRLRAEHGPSTLQGRFKKASEEVASHLTLNDARRTAKRKNKFVFVVILNLNNRQSMAEILTLWDDKTLKTVLKDHFIVVQYHSESTPGREFCNFYPVRVYPHLAIIDPRTGERLTYWSKRLEIFSLTTQIQLFLNNNSLTGKLEYPSVRPAQSKEVGEMSEQEQLEAAIQASLGPSEAPPADPYDSHVHIISDDDEDDLVDMMEDDYIPPAPVISPKDVISSLESQDIPDAVPGENSIRIQFRFPDGKIRVKCLSSSLKVSCLYQFVKVFIPKNAQELELICIRESLNDKLNLSVIEAGLNNSAINVTFIE